jgi:hypothetical protein
MTVILNCWEFKKCGREPGGEKASEMGVCPAATEERADGINSGKNGGRACWAIAGTLCKDKVQGSYALKLRDCMKCDFYQLVVNEEHWDFVSGGEIYRKLHKKS